MVAQKGHDYFSVLTRAINDISTHGYDSAQRIEFWMVKLRKAAEQTLSTDSQIQSMMRDALAKIYKRMVDHGQVVQFHQGVARFTIDRLRPQLRTELDRRILASVGLIKLNKQSAMEKTLQRFAGWSTSIPAGGSTVHDKREEKEAIRKPLAKIKFEERRVVIDQGQKLVANINNIIATDGGAIALQWHSRFRQPGYSYREDHKERDYGWNKTQGRQWVYLLRNCWAHTQGLVKTGDAGYYDQVTSVGQEVFCKCSAVYVYSLRDLPANMLTKKGELALADARAKIKSVGKMIA